MTVLMISLAFFAWRPPASSAREGQIYDVVIENNTFKFEPDKLKIKIGDSVRWHNKDENKHVLASVPGSGPGEELEIFSDQFRPGDVYTHQFNSPGEYPYFCFIHNRMTGVITVLPADP
jgi:plastocyanin